MKHKVNFPKESLIIGTCICCRRRNDHIVIGDGRCTDCIYDGETSISKWTKGQREFTIANVNTVIGMLIIYIIHISTDYPTHPFVPTIIQWFVCFTIASIAITYIYNLIKR
jgi:hypothetical protein